MDKVSAKGPSRPDQRVSFKHKLISYRGCKLHADFVSVMPEVEELECEHNDMFLYSFPKSGTTWTGKIIELIKHDGSKEKLAASLIRGAEYGGRPTTLFKMIEARFGNTIALNFIRATPHPRYLWSHLPRNLLPQSAIEKKCKIVYVYRHVKDVMVSYYYFHASDPSVLIDNLGIFEDFAERFMSNQVANTPYFANLHSYWSRRHEPNIFLLSYEHLEKDHAGIIRKLATFLGKDLTEEQVGLVRYQTSFSEMKKDAPNDQWLLKDESGKNCWQEWINSLNI
ncbi:hypothetical protein RvY_06481 [Ramazzottius varieornatus]|uniref:Sulfotransferase domain-containing protein n=1 Tax=Ramazzottius varieornatus TaxID=947166 RepID=A0A1D1V472_RAMVA|nr:hypothetical protein RvY_06481 [Ramazzottius varieornatus]